MTAPAYPTGSGLDAQALAPSLTGGGPVIGAPVSPAPSIPDGLPASPNAPFDAWTLAEAQAALDSVVHGLVGSPEAFDANRAYAEAQDHWQGGAGWVGPNGGDDSARRSVVLRAVARQFTPVDVVGEVLDRIVDGVLEREAAITFVAVDPPEDPESPEAVAQQAEADAMVARLSAWWDRVRLWEAARLACRRSRWAGRGVLRLWVPKSEYEVDDAGTPALPAGLTPEAALAALALQAAVPGTAALYTDPDTLRTCALFSYVVDRRPHAEVWYVDREDETGGDGTTDGAPAVVVRVLRTDGEASVSRLPLAGRLPITEMLAPVLITEPVRAQQKQLNFLNSIVTRSGETAGFPERYITNAEPNGVYLDTPPTDGPALATVPGEDGRTWYLHPMPDTLGAAITTRLSGLQTTATDINGVSHTTIATPGVTIKPPTDPQYAINGATHARAMILESCRQGHVLDAQTREKSSGVSRQQARADHDKDLHKTKAPLEGLLRDTLAAAITFAGAMTDDAPFKTFLDRYRVQVTCRVSSGPLTADEARANAELVKDGLLPAEDAMQLNGVDDTDAAVAKIQADPAYLADLWTKRGAALLALTQAGASLDGAAQVLGVDPADAALLLQSDAGGVPALNGGVTQ